METPANACVTCDLTFTTPDEVMAHVLDVHMAAPSSARVTIDREALKRMPGGLSMTPGRCSTCGGGDIHLFHCPQNTGGYRT